MPVALRALRARRIAGLAAAGLAAAAMLTLPLDPASAAPGKIRNAGAPGAIADSYIVVFTDAAVPRDQVRPTVDRLAAKHRAQVTFRYGTALRGFAARMPKAGAERLASDPAVAYVEQDQTVTAVETQSPTPSYGLDRIDQRDRPLNNSYTYPNSGAG